MEKHEQSLDLVENPLVDVVKRQRHIYVPR